MQCSGNTYNPVAGGTCLQCGTGTTPNDDHTDCINTCKFSLYGHQYDFTQSYQQGVYTDPDYYFFVDFCQRLYNNGQAYAEQLYTDYSIAAYTGSRVSFDESPDGNTNVIVATFDLGDDWGGCPEPRKTIVYLGCTMDTLDAGSMGTIFGVHGEDPNTPCVYEFSYNYTYFCPICDDSFIESYNGPCIGGVQTVNYRYKSPLSCHDGKQLPAATTKTCVDSNVACPAGQRLSDDGNGCTACAPGQISVGGGIAIQSWPEGYPVTLPQGFLTQCLTPGCEPWESHDGITILSGTGDSELKVDLTFPAWQGMPPFVNFEFKFYSPDKTGFFNFSIGNTTYISMEGTNIYEFTHLALPAPAPGRQTVSWKFHGGVHDSPSLHLLRGVAIQNVYVTGLRAHDDSCTPCPKGFRAPTDAEIAAGNIICQPCGVNTYSAFEGDDSCLPCKDNEYSFSGATFCYDRYTCTFSDFVWEYSDCINGFHMETPVLMEPSACMVDPNGYNPPSGVEGNCQCPLGTMLSQGTRLCEGAPSGMYYNGTNQYNGQFVRAPAGNVVERQLTWFDGSHNTWPDGFSTACSGLCGTQGWRFDSNNYIDSGSHTYNNVDSWFFYNFTLVMDGNISFDYSTSFIPTGNDGVMMLIDGYTQNIPVIDVNNAWANINIPLKAGIHELTFNYHQEQNGGSVSIRNMIVSGAASTWGNSKPVPCPAGTALMNPTDQSCTPCWAGYISDTEASTTCKICPVNTYALNTGSTSCTPCEAGSYTDEEGSTVCKTNCSFNVNNNLFGLPYNSTVSTYDNSRQEYQINVCGAISNAPPGCENSHVCFTNTQGQSIGFGKTFAFSPSIPSNASADVTSFSVTFAQGPATTSCPSGTSAYITFSCDTYSTATSPTFVSSDGCSVNFLWATINACRTCTSADYKYVEGVCSGGHRDISETRITNCNGPASIPHDSKKCSSKEFPTGAVVAVVVVFVVVALVAVVVIVRNRYLARQYGKLLTDTRTHEMAPESRSVHSSSAVL
jgi:hypothetical protein